jgi:hypothetical protein
MMYFRYARHGRGKACGTIRDRRHFNGFNPVPTRKVSDDLSRDALGLRGFTERKVSLKSLTSWLYPLP